LDVGESSQWRCGEIGKPSGLVEKIFFVVVTHARSSFARRKQRLKNHKRVFDRRLFRRRLVCDVVALLDYHCRVVEQLGDKDVTDEIDCPSFTFIFFKFLFQKKDFAGNIYEQ
jgi:hypothetical protein